MTQPSLAPSDPSDPPAPSDQSDPLAPSRCWRAVDEESSVAGPTPAVASALQLVGAVAGAVALVLPGARYSQHTPFGDLHGRLSAGGALFVGVGTEDNLRGMLDGLIPTFVLGLWFALVVGIAVTGLRYRYGTGLTGFAVSAVSVGVAATQFWSLVSMVLQMNSEGAGWPEPGLAVVFGCLALCLAATVMWWRHLRSSLLDF